MSFTSKSCITCEWYESNMFVPGCRHPLFMNPVNGNSKYSCHFVRSSETRCGREGKYWEPKDNK